MLKISKILLSFTICISTLISLLSCAGKAPDISEVKDEFTGLIEASYEINEIFFGNGLPIEEEFDGIPDEYNGYVYVSDSAKFGSIDEIKEAAEKVYSKEYLLYAYETVFTGYVDSSAGILLTARYLEDNGRLLQAKDTTALYYGVMKYDYSTMKIVKPSTTDLVNVDITAWVEGVEDVETSEDFSDEYNDFLSGKKQTIRLTFVKQDGKWYLDSPTY